LLARSKIPNNSNEHPVFFGSDWMTGMPDRQAAKLACVVDRVANDGRLVSYRFGGE
jgi:hypothetical protein